MPKEAFYTWSGPGEHRKIFELRWAKETDVDPAKTVVYLPPLPEDTPDGVFEMIGNGGDISEIDRLIEALRRAKRAMLGTSTGVDAAVDTLPDGSRERELLQNSRLNNGVVFAPEEKHNPADICPVPGCNCDLDYRAAAAEARPDPSDLWAQKDLLQEQIAVEEGWKANDPFPSVYEIVTAYEDESPLHLGARAKDAKASGERVRRLLQERKFNDFSREQIMNHVSGRAWEANDVYLKDGDLNFVVDVVQEILLHGVVK